MRDDGYCIRNLNVLLSLLESEIKNGSLSDIMKECGYRSCDGGFYKIRDWLIKESVLIEEGNTTIRSGFGEKVTPNYKIDQDAIKSILYAEWKTKVLYKNIIRGKISVIPSIKPRKRLVITDL